MAESLLGNVYRTTDATVTTTETYTPTDAYAATLIVDVVARKSDGSQAAGYRLAGTFRRAGATTTQVGATTIYSHEDDAAWNVALDTSGSSVRVRVTGVAATTIDWRVKIWRALGVTIP